MKPYEAEEVLEWYAGIIIPNERQSGYPIFDHIIMRIAEYSELPIRLYCKMV